MAKSAAEIEAEIEAARASLAKTVDELAVRTSPKRLADDAKQSVIAKVQSPQGRVAIGAVGGLVLLMVVRNLRKAKRNRQA